MLTTGVILSKSKHNIVNKFFNKGLFVNKILHLKVQMIIKLYHALSLYNNYIIKLL